MTFSPVLAPASAATLIRSLWQVCCKSIIEECATTRILCGRCLCSRSGAACSLIMNLRRASRAPRASFEVQGVSAGSSPMFTAVLHTHDFYSGALGVTAARLCGVKVIAAQRHLRLSDRRIHDWGTRLLWDKGDVWVL